MVRGKGCALRCAAGARAKRASYDTPHARTNDSARAARRMYASDTTHTTIHTSHTSTTDAHGMSTASGPRMRRAESRVERVRLFRSPACTVERKARVEDDDEIALVLPDGE